MKLKVYTLNSFAKSENGGNPAGVVLNAENLSEDQMKKVAQKVGLSETAFVKKSSKADFKVRFFTPTEEVDLCGHATIATFYLLKELELVKAGKYTQETKAGVLSIDIKPDKTVFMEQNIPQFFKEINRQEIASSLNLAPEKISNNIPVQIVSTGLKDIMVPIENLEDLNSINPDFEKISDISQKYNTVGYHVFTLNTSNNVIARARNFAPLYGIPEESATGTSTGALACYLFKHGKISAEENQKMKFEQGYSMKKPSEILVSLATKNNEIISVEVGGTASNIKEIEMEMA